MNRIRTILMLLALGAVAVALTSCGTDSAVGPDPDKRPPEYNLYDIPQDFLASVVDVYNSNAVIWDSLAVTIDLAGDVVVVQPTGWPATHTITVRAPLNPRIRERHTFMLHYPSLNPLAPGAIFPDDVTLYRFTDLPHESYGVTLDLPPAPWFPKDVLQGMSTSYAIEGDPDGGYDIDSLSMTPTLPADPNNVIRLPVAATDRPREDEGWAVDPLFGGGSDEPSGDED